MRKLLRSTTAYRSVQSDAAGASSAHATLVLFPDEAYLRPLLKECAKAFFSAQDGSRQARLIDEENYADCIFCPPAGEKLTADMAAGIVDESLLLPVEGDRKLFVLDNFHTVTPLVQNKLLKLLEEPPEGVCFLLGACVEHAVLPTVLSRVKRLAVPPFSEEEIRNALERNHGGEAGLAQAAAASGGLYSAAESLLGGGEVFELAKRFLREENIPLCRELGERKEKRAIFSALRLLLRDMLFYRTDRTAYVSAKDFETQALAEEYAEGAILAALRLTDEAEKQVQFNANFGQALLTLAVGIRKEKELWQKLS